MAKTTRQELRNQRPCRICQRMFDRDREQCPSCLAMNIEGLIDMSQDDGTILLSDGDYENPNRISTGPWDSIFGTHKDGKKVVSGIVDTSVNLLGGAPGAGKSTLSLQMASNLAKTRDSEVLYIAGEESTSEIKGRASRLKIKNMNQIRMTPMGRELNLDFILRKRRPAACIIDSLPTIMPDPSDAIEFVKKIKPYAVDYHMPVIIIDHVTKAEEFAGMMGLQHQVDGTFIFTVFDDGIRQLKAIKNRNGTTGIDLFFQMTEEGLVPHADIDDDDDDE